MEKIHKWVPNGLSIFRGILGVILPFFLLWPDPRLHGWALFIFSFGALTDYWDGEYARRYKVVSSLGKIIDPTADKILFLAPLCAFSRMEFYSIWLVAPIFARELVITFCRIGWLLEGKAVGAEKLGKLKFVSQVALVLLSMVYLLAIDFKDSGRVFLISHFLMLMALALAFVLTVWSGITFFVANRENFKSVAFTQFTSALGVGLLPRAPGTWGSLVGLVFVLLIRGHLVLYAIVFFLLLWIAYWSVGRLDLRVNKDPSYVVIDEALGIMLTFFAIPLSVTSVTVGFLLFRLFDIWKPFPVCRCESLPGVWGIVADDLVAACYAWLLLMVFFR